MNKIPKALERIAITTAALGAHMSDYYMGPTPSFTAGVNKYAKRVSNEDALTEDEKRRNAEIDAANAAKKAARKAAKKKEIRI